MMDGSPSKTCRVLLYVNKFETLMHLVGFTIEIVITILTKLTMVMTSIAGTSTVKFKVVINY